MKLLGSVIKTGKIAIISVEIIKTKDERERCDTRCNVMRSSYRKV